MPETDRFANINELSLTAQQHARSAVNLLEVMDLIMGEIDTDDREVRNRVEGKLITLTSLAREAAERARACGEEIEKRTLRAQKPA